MNLIDIYAYLQADLEYIEQQLLAHTESEDPLVQEAAQHLLEAGGKRIRPVFVLLGGRTGQHDYQEKLKHVAVALELVHMATLVHDDVIDNADIRRGRPTVKAKWDNQLAMYVGNFIFSEALVCISQLQNERVHRILSKALVEMCVGEIEQIEAQFDWEQSIRTYFVRIKRKTALLMAISGQLGAIASGATEKTIQAIYWYGYYIGMAFQMTDDILDFTATEEQLGKPAGSDLLQGLITLPIFAAFRDEQVRQSIIAEMSTEHPDMHKVIDWVHASGGIRYSQNIVRKYTQKAKQVLGDLHDVENKDTLSQIADFIEQRSY